MCMYRVIRKKNCSSEKNKDRLKQFGSKEREKLNEWVL